MKHEFFLSEKFQFLVVKFSIFLNRRVFVMARTAHKISHLIIRSIIILPKWS